jgi:hypothetical protein
MQSPCSLCILLINIRMAEPFFMKFGTYIMVPDPISTAYFITLSISLCVYMCIPISLLSNRSVKIPLSLLENGSAKMLPWQRIHTWQCKNCWKRRLLCGPCRIKENRRLVFPRISYLFFNNSSGWMMASLRRGPEPPWHNMTVPKQFKQLTDPWLQSAITRRAKHTNSLGLIRGTWACVMQWKTTAQHCVESTNNFLHWQSHWKQFEGTVT